VSTAAGRGPFQADSALQWIFGETGRRLKGEESSVRELLDDLDRWRRQGKRVAIARVVDIEGSGPRDPGAAMAVSEDGVVSGSVSGGCVEGAVVEAALESLKTGERRVHTFGFSDTDAFAVGLTCGGTIHLFVEPLDW
jgi:xanthine dehydrogenase accessory factor